MHACIVQPYALCYHRVRGKCSARTHHQTRHAAILIGKTLAQAAQVCLSVCLRRGFSRGRPGKTQHTRIIIFIEKLSSFATRRPIFHKA